MGFHICNVGYVFGIPVLLFWEAPPNDQVLFVLNSTSNKPTLLRVKPVNTAASRVSSSRLNLIITLAESVSFKRGELAVNARVVKQPSPHLKIFLNQRPQEGRRRGRVQRQEPRTPKLQPQHIATGCRSWRRIWPRSGTAR